MGLRHRLGAPAGLLLLGLVLAACAGPDGSSPASGRPAASAAATPAAPTGPTAAASAAPLDSPSCSGKATPALTEGPYFKPGSPERTSLLEPGMAGTRLVLTGRVLNRSCQPVTGAVLDFWQADASGSYDNSGYRLRGHQATGAGGSYTLTTVIPGEYPGRTEHIHVKVGAPGRPVLTTQLFFPGVARNSSDSIFDPALLVSLTDGTAGAKSASYDFVMPG
jgi:protocatechuate 3,4-dioxygenase beta subunit